MARQKESEPPESMILVALYVSSQSGYIFPLTYLRIIHQPLQVQSTRAAA